MNGERSRAMLLTAIGKRTRALRLEAGMTVREFAKRASLSQRFVNQLESGDGNISIAGLARVAAALGRTPHELIPPLANDRSAIADLWRFSSTASRDDLEDLQQWIESRTNDSGRSKFIALIGLRGAGKSTVGQALARRLKSD